MSNRYHQGPPSDHFDGKRFFNQGQESTDRSLGATDLQLGDLAGAGQMSKILGKIPKIG